MSNCRRVQLNQTAQSDITWAVAARVYLKTNVLRSKCHVSMHAHLKLGKNWRLHIMYNCTYYPGGTKPSPIRNASGPLMDSRDFLDFSFTFLLSEPVSLSKTDFDGQSFNLDECPSKVEIESLVDGGFVKPKFANIFTCCPANCFPASCWAWLSRTFKWKNDVSWLI